MKKTVLLVDAIRSHRVAAGAFFLLALALIATAISIPVLRSNEEERLEKAATESSELLIKALSNPAIFTGEPDTSVSELEAVAQELSRVHDTVVLEKVRFAKKAAQAALGYTEYSSRIGTKLTQVAQAQQRAGSSTEVYDRDVAILKASSLALRSSAQDDVNSIVSEARASTELAYQECALLATLTNEFGIVRSRALTGLKTVGPDVEPAITALKPNLHAALDTAHARRKVFNPAARAPS